MPQIADSESHAPMKGNTMPTLEPTRRNLLRSAAAIALVLASRSIANADDELTMKVWKDPSCGCCSAWIEHVRAAGFKAEVIDSADMSRIKAKLGLPAKLASCHTAEVGSYVVEGHVPADAIKRLLSEKSLSRGLAVPGMPVGAPGMEVPGTEPEFYEVISFGPGGERTFGRYKGHARV